MFYPGHQQLYDLNKDRPFSAQLKHISSLMLEAAPSNIYGCVLAQIAEDLKKTEPEEKEESEVEVSKSIKTKSK